MLKLFSLLIMLALSFQANAQVKWQYQSHAKLTSKPVIYNERLYLTNGAQLTILSKQGKLLQTIALPATSYSEVVIDKNTVFVLSDKGLSAFDHQGKALWHFTSQDNIPLIDGETWGFGAQQVEDNWAIYRSAPIIIENKVIFANAQGTFALDKYSGKKLWHAQTGVTHTKPAFANNTIVVGSWNNNLYGLNPSNGEIIWQFTARTPQGSMANWQGWQGFNLSPVIYNNTVYVGSRGSYFYAIDLAKGIERWSVQFASTWIGSPAIVHQNNVYFGTSDGYSLVGLNAQHGSQSLLHLNDFYNFAQPAAKNDHIYYGTMSGQVYKVNLKTMVGENIFSTEQSQENYDETVKKTGGLKLLYSKGNQYNYPNAQKDVTRMLNKLDSILSTTIDIQTLYLTSVSGALIAFKISNN